MAADKKQIFLESNNFSSDCCARKAREAHNDLSVDWVLYQHLPIPCETPNMRSPDFQYDHTNLRARIGYGQTDDCVVDEFSKLRNDPAQLTRDRCRIQLFERIFQGCPNLKPGVADAGAEIAIQQGTNNEQIEGVSIPCKKTIMELDTSHRIPLVDCMKDIQEPEHIVPTWTWGGEPTRDFERRKEFLNRCGYGMKTLH